jgi:hypothetical protein
MATAMTSATTGVPTTVAATVPASVAPGVAGIALQPFRPRQCGDLRRYGNRSDGGYVVPQCAIAASDVLLSLGVEADWSFEADALAERPGLRLCCVDGTTGPEIIRARQRRDLYRALRQLRPRKLLRLLRDRDRPERFRAFFAQHELLPLLVAAAAGPGAITLPGLLAHVRGADPARRVFIKMDMEGAEYAVLAGAADALAGVTGLAVEFHDLATRWPQLCHALALLQPRFHIVHIHGNNNDGLIAGTRVPQTLEISFAARELLAPHPPVSTARYPIAGLDYPNRPRRPDLELSFD